MGNDGEDRRHGPGDRRRSSGAGPPAAGSRIRSPGSLRDHGVAGARHERLRGASPHEAAPRHTPGRSPIAGDARNRDETFAQYGRYGTGTAGTFRAEFRTAAGTDDGRVIAMHHNAGEREGRSLAVDCCILFEVEDGRIVSGREHFYDLYAWDAFWA
jgi:uncharacterized protein